MAQTGVRRPIVANAINRIPRTKVLEIRTPRYPIRPRIRGIIAFMLMEAMAWGMTSRPDWIGVNGAAGDSAVSEHDAWSSESFGRDC